MLRKETVYPHTFQLLEDLSKEDILVDFKLVGGTALSLQLGHRISTDLDFFSNKDFHTDKIIRLLEKFGNVTYTATGENLVQGYINNIKIDFASHKYKWIDKGIMLNNIEICSINDISAMKLGAVLARAKKRDFIDIAAILKKSHLPELIKNFKTKYKQYNTFHVLRAVGYFKDAENDSTPLKILDESVSWDESKKTIEMEINKLNRNRGMSFGM